MGLIAGLSLGGCTAKATTAEDNAADKFREAIPATADVATGVPGSASGATGASSDLQAPGAAPQATADAAPSYATYYTFTRNVADGVDAVTGVILGAVWLVVHTPPASVTDQQAVWGPGNGDALSPVVWRLTVTEVAQDEFDYKLDGRPKASTSEADYLNVLSGHGYGLAHPQHRNGTFTVDNDASHTLDPVRNHDTGKVTIDHRLHDWPAVLSVQIRPSDKPDWLDITVTHQQDQSGEVDVNGLTDIEAVKDGNLEDVLIHSRWDHTGAGRADVTLSGGDLGPTLIVKASECWSSVFARTYYTDSVMYQPTEGDPGACVFPMATF
jgi:hypothetical protein